MKCVCFRVLPPRKISQSSVGVLAFHCSVTNCRKVRLLLQLFLSDLCLIRAGVNRNKTLRLTSNMPQSLVIHGLIHEVGMSSTSAQRKYRARLREAGRKEILLDLPVGLIAKLDECKTDGGKRSALVEQLLEQALSGESQEVV